MQYVGIDLHTNRFTCCYLTDNPGEKRVETFNLNAEGLRHFYATIGTDSSVLIEATINTFAFTALFRDLVSEIIVANTYQLKSVGIPGKKTDKIDAGKLAEKLKAQVISGVQQIVPVTVPPKEIRDLRALFASYRTIRKEIGQTKNRIHSLLKENLFPFTKAFIFGKKSRKEIRDISTDRVLSFQINALMDSLEQLETTFDTIVEELKIAGSPFMREIAILTSMSGLSVITALAIIADVIDIARFRNSKHFASYLRSTPRVESSNGTTVIKSTNKAGRKLSISLLSQSLNHFRDENKKLKRWYEQLQVYKKKGVVRMALCRRVFTELFQMLKKGEYHYFRNPALHEKKMAAYFKFLENNNVFLPENLKVSA